jgi:hypothetical protein
MAIETEIPDIAPVPLSGTRAQAVQRLQIGLSGLGAMILLVGLANVIMDRAIETEAGSVPEAASTVGAGQLPASASDPLADAGVAPDLPAEQVPSPGAAGNPDDRPVQTD